MRIPYEKNILLVEDDLSIAEMVKEHLIKEGFSIVHASEGEKAKQLFLIQSFDMILLDLRLQGDSYP